MICVQCIAVLYFAYQCFFDDFLLCCKTCAIDGGLLKTTYSLTYLLRRMELTCSKRSSTIALTVFVFTQYTAA